MVHEYFGTLILILDLSVMMYGLMLWSKMDRGFRTLTVLFIISFISGLSAFITSKLGITNLPLLHLYTLWQLSLTVLAFSYWDRDRKARTVLRTTIGIFALFWIISKLTLEDLRHFPTVTDPVAAGIMVAAGIRLLFAITRESRRSLFRIDRFWMAAGVLLGSTGSLLAFGASNAFLETDVSAFDRLWTIIWSANIASNICFLSGLKILKGRD